VEQVFFRVVRFIFSGAPRATHTHLPAFRTMDIEPLRSLGSTETKSLSHYIMREQKKEAEYSELVSVRTLDSCPKTNLFSGIYIII